MRRADRGLDLANLVRRHRSLSVDVDEQDTVEWEMYISKPSESMSGGRSFGAVSAWPVGAWD